MEYIVNTNPLVMKVNYEEIKQIENKIKNKESLTEEEANYFLDFVVYATRCKVVKDFNETFEYKCDLAQSIMTYYLRSLGVETYPKSTQEAIAKDIEGHNFNVVRLNILGKDKDYLVDATYRQFFLKENCQDSKFIIHQGLILVSAHPGYFIKKEDYSLVEEFLKHGYMEMNEKNAKVYGDSFFKTKTMIRKEDIPSYQLPGSSYIKLFLKGDIHLSKSEDELKEAGLLISSDNENIKKSF